jgi:hypothetical protein
MNSLDNLERTRRLALYATFVFSFLLFFSFVVRIIYFWWHVHKSFPYENAFLVVDLALITAILAIALWRWLALRAFIKRNPLLRPKDERERFAWLNACRPAFFVLLIAQLLGKMVMFIYPAPYEVPVISQLSLSAALMTIVGAFLYYSRESCHE